MNHMRLLFYAGIMLAILLAACTPAGTPTSPPPPPPEQPTVVPVTKATFASAPPIATSTTAPLILAGPPMQVGSTYLYFDGALLVAVPAGPFQMGHGGSDNPVHTVTLSDFWIYSTKVTNMEYQRCIAVGKCTAPDLKDNLGFNDPMRQSDPVVGVDWSQGEAYCQYANGHLPTEAQWEKTARGPNGNDYPWGSNAPAKDLLNYNNYIGQTTNVISYPKGKSYYSALEMEGNVYEWVFDWYDPLYYKNGPVQDPPGPDSGVGGNRSARSAGYKSNDDQVVPSTRLFKLPTEHARDLGFRCVVKDPSFFAPMCQMTASVGPDLSGSSGSASSQTPQNISVSIGYAGCGKNAYAVVTFDDSQNPDPNANITGVGGCSQNASGSHYAQYTCTNIPAGGFDVGISSQCPAPTQTTLQCPAHYNLSGNTCQWDGTGTQGQNCPAGTQYDPVHMCCMSTPGTGTNSSACQAGSMAQPVGNSGNYVCVSAQSSCFVSPNSAHVDQPSNPCGSSGGGPNQCPNGGTYTCVSSANGTTCYCR